MTRGAPWPQASTRLVALLGWPARHSLSPLMHNAAFAEQDLDLVYVALPTPTPDLERVVRTLGAVGAVGANVTVPHKQAVVTLCDHLTAEAEAVGAVNTLSWNVDGLLGDNTDATGLEQVLRDDVGLATGAAAVVLGTGGAARATCVALGRLAAHVTVVGRRADAASELAELAVSAGASRGAGVDLHDDGRVRAAVREAGLVLNATPLGMNDEPLPGAFMDLHDEQTAYDLVYRPAETPFLQAARAAGATAHHGLGMLVAQAARSFRRWTGHDAPVGLMSAVALRALSSAGGRSPATDT